MVLAVAFSPETQPQHLVCGYILNLREKIKIMPC